MTLIQCILGSNIQSAAFVPFRIFIIFLEAPNILEGRERDNKLRPISKSSTKIKLFNTQGFTNKK